ncbi:hypothetical protein BSZ19_18685 [Bradyrhizobium japonicum]|uniref:Uncharacterized protein n=1 Tax=Bradyrhizobium japonicum TaxID=375 RepID=A0A1Y2JQ61_BRAJP|nr:hypothetical protein [Bradyrhizobium japonicum]OSJ32578.1 hypothetical protein BSZ19_18685 [Bradyrhizobium japonicum]
MKHAAAPFAHDYQWRTFGHSIYRCCRTTSIWKGVQNWSLPWIVLIMAVSFTPLAIAELRRTWIRLRDVVARA